ncbi:MAG: twin-arginine translocation signal domain-containing protein, partial [Deltaproteobacteria bacterium]|nr:twin-arginine translocation signal domain-containing protein [Deltaproteobacteria bacterium]
MRVSDNTDREKCKMGDQFFDSQLSRRNFLKFFGAAAVSGGALLDSTPAVARETTRRELEGLAFQSNSEELYWRMVRAEFALKDELIHMNTGTLSST